MGHRRSLRLCQSSYVWQGSSTNIHWATGITWGLGTYRTSPSPQVMQVALCMSVFKPCHTGGHTELSSIDTQSHHWPHVSFRRSSVHTRLRPHSKYNLLSVLMKAPNTLQQACWPTRLHLQCTPWGLPFFQKSSFSLVCMPAVWGLNTWIVGAAAVVNSALERAAVLVMQPQALLVQCTGMDSHRAADKLIM